MKFNQDVVREFLHKQSVELGEFAAKLQVNEAGEPEGMTPASWCALLHHQITASALTFSAMARGSYETIKKDDEELAAKVADEYGQILVKTITEIFPEELPEAVMRSARLHVLLKIASFEQGMKH
jgi:hypothetical protein